MKGGSDVDSGLTTPARERLEAWAHKYTKQIRASLVMIDCLQAGSLGPYISGFGGITKGKLAKCALPTAFVVGALWIAGYKHQHTIVKTAGKTKASIEKFLNTHVQSHRHWGRHPVVPTRWQAFENAAADLVPPQVKAAVGKIPQFQNPFVFRYV
ncbi:hypothetical protein PG991_008003 [Apiospora marii]|uniref:Uncharacterized protein n=1 Tax=Apiospora marii TaxID=335849 RepID=A0ABR1RX40_9PEZI